MKGETYEVLSIRDLRLCHEANGARKELVKGLTLTLARELRRRGARYGLAGACIGGGQGVAVILESLD